MGPEFGSVIKETRSATSLAASWKHTSLPQTVLLIPPTTKQPPHELLYKQEDTPTTKQRTNAYHRGHYNESSFILRASPTHPCIPWPIMSVAFV